MPKVALLWILATLNAPGVAAPAAREPVRVESGLLEGAPGAEGDTVAFLGVPYAAPPVGNLRWREPQPAPPWEGVRKADQFGAMCPQAKPESGPASEDCLFLNLWAPARAPAEKLPVLFFVHGGCYQFGSGNFDGEGMAKKGILLVTVNHRLGHFNSMGHPELTRESPLKSCANYGSLDLIAALKWLHRNVGAFGGDPARITICGQSTGASNVHYLTASPMATGLFHGVIAISFPYDYLMKRDAVGNQWQAEQAGLKLAREKGLATLDDLRNLPAGDLVGGGGGPTIRTSVYPRGYPEAVAAGLPSDVPTLTGLTWDDFGPPAQHDPYTNLELFKKRVARACPPEKLEEVLSHYPAKNDAEARERWKQVGNEIRMADLFHWARVRARTAKTPVYTYVFTHAQPMEPKRGAYHGSDLFYEFNNVRDPARGWRDEDRQVAAQVSSYWVNFVKTGNPNSPGLPEWKAFDPADPSTMHLGVTSGFQPICPSPEAWNLLHRRSDE